MRVQSSLDVCDNKVEQRRQENFSQYDKKSNLIDFAA